MTNVKKSLKKLGALALCLCLALALLPTAAFAAETYTITLGTATGIGNGTITVANQTLTNANNTATVTGGDVTFKIEANSGYYIFGWTIGNNMEKSSTAQTKEVTVTISEDTTIHVGFKQLATVTGSVKSSGTTVKDLPVTLSFTDGTNTYTSTTDTSGSYTAYLPEGTWTITANGNEGLLAGSGSVTVSEAGSTVTADTISMGTVRCKVIVNKRGSGEGTITIGGTTLSDFTDKTIESTGEAYKNATTIVDKGNVEFVFTPASGSYVKSYNVTVLNNDSYTSGIVKGTATVTADVATTTGVQIFFEEYVTVSGTVSQESAEDGGATPALPATVVFTDSNGNTYEATTDANGNYEVSLPQDNCSYVATGQGGIQQSETGTITITSETTTVPAITMTNTTDGDTLVTEKAAAATKIANDVQAAKDAIDKMENLSEDEKTAKIEAVNAAATTAKEKIAAATTKNAVTEAQTNGETAISDVQTAASDLNTLNGKKSEAESAIDTKAQAAKDAINAMENLTDDNKTALKAEIEAAGTKAQNAVDTATSKTAVDDALTTLNTDIDAIEEEAAAKAEANAAIDEEAQAAKDDLIGMNLLDAEKEALETKIDAAAATAKGAVNGATVADYSGDNGKIAAAQAALATALADIQAEAEAEDLANDKTDAKSDIESIAQRLIDNIEDASDTSVLPDLTGEERAAYVQQITDALEAAKTAVDGATNQDGINEATEALNTSLNLISAKASATNSINADAQAATKALDELTSLTDEEKAAYVQKITDEASATAKAAVDDATDENGIKSATDTLTSDLKTIKEKSEAQNLKNKELQDAKDTALEQIESDAQAARDAINKMDNLTSAEKEDLMADVDTAEQTAKKAVNAAEDQDAVAAAKTALTEDLAEIEDGAETKELANAKSGALSEIDAAAKAAEEAIDKLTSLTDAEKQAAKDKIAAAAKTAKEAVNAATTTDGVKKALETLDTSIDATQDEAEEQNEANGKAADAEKALEDAKTAAKKQIESDEQAAIDAINAQTNLTDDEKAALLSEVEKAAAAAKEDLNKAATTGAVQDVLDDLTEVLDAAQYDAKKQDEAAAAEKTAEDFVTKYLTGKDGSLYKEASSSNYSSILSGTSAWNAMTQAEKDAVNAKLTANGGVAYEQLLTGAQTAKKTVESSKGTTDGAKKTAPYTGDDTPIALYAVLALACAAGLGITAVTAKKRKAQR